ncbi:MAG: PD-(D/E)XK nuclease-like domain-containing protein [Ignavibacteriaceae bacterium]|nr:PD-(D/E)XK nuclease-like domain-containing protein [Ignavibacteriaceae bacterium]
MSKEELIRKLQKNEIVLSFSSLKEFAKSPRHFVKYKTEEKKQTQAMKIGKAFHCMILEPLKFDELYIVNFQHEMPFPNKDLRNAENKKAKEVLLKEAKEAGKELLTETEYEELKTYQRIINDNQISKSLLNKITKTEVKIEYVFNGLNFIGYIDAIGNGMILDLKKCADATPKVAIRTSFQNLWNLQGCLYTFAIDEFMTFYNIAVDLESVTVLNYSSEAKEAGFNQLQKLTDNFKKCIDGNLWDSGYEFWADNQKGMYTI